MINTATLTAEYPGTSFASHWITIAIIAIIGSLNANVSAQRKLLLS